jgi:hypothetical protein
VTWVKLDDRFPVHPKVITLDDRAFRLHVTALCYAAEHLTDGEIQRRTLPLLARNSGITRPAATVNRLVTAGLWDVNDDGWTIHDYLLYNPAKQEIERERAAARERMKRVRGGDVQGERSPEGSPERSGTPYPSRKNKRSSPQTSTAEPAGEEPLRCPACVTLTFKRERELRDHLDNVHWLEGDQLDQAVAQAVEAASAT